MINIRPASASDIPVILRFIRELAEFEKLLHEVKADEASLQQTLFNEDNGVQILIAEINAIPAGFALFFKSYSTFLAKPGIYLEDLYVSPNFRSQGIGESL